MAERKRKRGPLTLHPNGQWCKRIRTKLYYFGTDREAALAKYRAMSADLHDGRISAPVSASMGIEDLVNLFLTRRHDDVDAGALTSRFWWDYRRIGDIVVETFGPIRPAASLTPDDFGQLRLRLAEGRGPHALGRAVACVRKILNWGYQNGRLPAPPRYGDQFGKPDLREKRLAERDRRALHGKRLFEAAEVRAMLKASEPQLRAMIYLGVNCGFGNKDCAELPIGALDLNAGMMHWARGKTGIEREAPLWPETVKALREVLKDRPAATDADLVFVTKYGRPWVHTKEHRDAEGLILKVSETNAVSLMFGRLLTGLELKRPGISFYTLRHTFRTVADGARDQHAVHRIMGHDLPGMSATYVENIDAERLRAVTKHVRDWLNRKPRKPTKKSAAG